MPNPAEYFTQKELEELGLSPAEISTSYQPSKGGVYHLRGDEGTGKTLWIAHFIKDLIDNKGFLPSEGYGNISLKGKYAQGYHMLRGEALYQHLMDLYEKPLKHTFTVISEIDLEFPARFFGSKQQTLIALGMWQMLKLDNYVLYDSHAGNSTDLIFHLAAQYIVLPNTPDFETQSLDFTMINKLKRETTYWTAYDVVKTMLIYNRQETTANFQNLKKKKQEKGYREDKLILPDSFELDSSEIPAY